MKRIIEAVERAERVLAFSSSDAARDAVEPLREALRELRALRCVTIREVTDEEMDPTCKCGHTAMWHGESGLLGDDRCELCECGKFDPDAAADKAAPAEQGGVGDPCPLCRGVPYTKCPECGWYGSRRNA